MDCQDNAARTRVTGIAEVNSRRITAMSISIAVSVVLMGLKFYTFWLTGSTAVLSDALESIINVVASGFALWSVVLSAKPPDASHPYGHGKAEFFSAGFEGCLIIFAAAGIIWEAIPEIMAPKSLPNLDAGLLILFAASLANFVLGTALVRTGKRTRSAAVTADGKHILTDVFTSVGVIAGLLLVRQTGWLWLDGGIACLVALNILYIGVRLVRESFSGLMDASDPELLDSIVKVISKNRRPQWIDVHRLRAWRSGDRVHVDFHLILPRDLTLDDAHKEVSEIEDILQAHIAGLGDAVIHAEPCISPECPICGQDPCRARCEESTRQTIWSRETVAGSRGEDEHALEASALKNVSRHGKKAVPDLGR